MHVTIWLSDSTPGYISKKLENTNPKIHALQCSYNNIFTVTKMQKQPKCPSTEVWIKKRCICIFIYMYIYCLVCQMCPTLYNPLNYSHQAPLSRGISGKNAGVGCHFLLQCIFPIQGLNMCFLCVLHCRQILTRWGIRGAHTMEYYSPMIFCHLQLHEWTWRELR